MSSATSYRPSTVERWLSLVVRYWAANMTLIHNRGSNWPGFGYSDEEKEEMRNMAAQVPKGEFMAFATILSVIAIAVFAVVVVAGMYCLIAAIGGEQNMPNTPASLFFLSLALECIVSLTIGLPAAMLPSAAFAGRFYKVQDQDLPSRRVTAHYFHKLWFQITRMTVIMTCAVLPLWIWVPADSKFMAIVRVIVPLLSPLVTGLTTAYYFTAKLKQDPQAQ